MNHQFKIYHGILFCCLAFLLQAAKGGTKARVEIIEPFPVWFLTENVDFFVRVSNTGDEAVRIAATAQEDLFFEIPPKITTRAGEVLNLPKVENAGATEPQGILLPPGRAYALSNADYIEAELFKSECFTRVCVHLLIERGRWISSKWIERKILPAPDLNTAFLYDYSIMADSPLTHSVILLPVNGENWLFSHQRGSKRV